MYIYPLLVLLLLSLSRVRASVSLSLSCSAVLLVSAAFLLLARLSSLCSSCSDAPPAGQRESALHIPSTMPMAAAAGWHERRRLKVPLGSFGAAFPLLFGLRAGACISVVSMISMAGCPLFPKPSLPVGFLLVFYRITFVDQDLPSSPGYLGYLRVPKPRYLACQ